MKWSVAAVALVAFTAPVLAEDQKPESPVTLKLIAKTDKYKFDGGGKTPADYKKSLEEIAKAQKDGKPSQTPKPQAVDLVLQLINTSKNEVTVYVGGDSNVYTFELTGGDGAVALNSGLAMTLEFRLPQPVTLGPGKTYCGFIADGFRI